MLDRYVEEGRDQERNGRLFVANDVENIRNLVNKGKINNNVPKCNAL